MASLTRLSILPALLLGVTAHAGIVVSNSAATVEGDSAFFLTTDSGGRTYQMVIHDGQLTGVIGQEIVGMQWRLSTGFSWPPDDAVFSSFDVIIGPGLDPSATSSTFASNFTAAPTQVRSGSLTFSAGSFPTGGDPNGFGPSLDFDAPYLYSGGDLTIELRFSVQNGARSQSPFDAIGADRGSPSGFGVDFVSRFNGGSTATAGGDGNFLVTNLITRPSAVPEPSSLALLGTGLTGLCGYRSRRKRKQAV